MLTIAFADEFLNRVDTVRADAWLRSATRLSGSEPLRLPEGASLPHLGETDTLLLFAGKGEGERVLRVHFGEEEVRETGVIWAKSPDAIDHLLEVEAGSGIFAALNLSSYDDARSFAARRYQTEIQRLEEKKAAYVFGARRLGEVVAAGLRVGGYHVAGIVDNNKSLWGQSVCGARVSELSAELDRSLPFIIGTTRFPFTLGEQLKAAGFSAILPYSVMNFLDAEHFPDEIPYVNNLRDLAENPANYITEYLAYDDEKSRRVMDNLILYRLTLDPITMQGVFESESEQYFDKDLISFGSNEVFVDAGGFDAQTSKWFIERAGGTFKKLFYFEPDPRLMEISRKALSSYDNVEFVQAGVFDMDGTARFVSTGTVNGAVSVDPGAGDMSIEVRTIDSVANVPITFIKMDVEGMESAALRGARRQIGQNAPTLAIACYHRGEHIWEIGRLIRDLYPSYRLNLRHYTEGGLETVIYANS